MWPFKKNKKEKISVDNTNTNDKKNIEISILANKLLNNNNKPSILQIFNLPIGKFHKAPSYLIKENIEDYKAGVIEVLVCTEKNKKFFNVFKNLIIKKFNNGDINYMIYDTIDDPQIIHEFFQELVNKFNIGFCDDKLYKSFNDINNISKISKGLTFSQKDCCNNHWILNDKYSLVLHYHVNPPKQLLFNIVEKNC